MKFAVNAAALSLCSSRSRFLLKVVGDQISFDVNRTVGDQKMLFKYSGKIAGDTITGKIIFGREKPLPHEWEAKRVKP